MKRPLLLLPLLALAAVQCLAQDHAANGVELRRDDDTFNANPDTNGNPAYRGIGQSTLLRIPDGQRPERFWFHGWVYSNYGGWAVLYDIDRGILYGHYSHN